MTPVGLYQLRKELLTVECSEEDTQKITKAVKFLDHLIESTKPMMMSISGRGDMTMGGRRGRRTNISREDGAL